MRLVPDLVERHHAAIGHVSRRTRRAVADEDLAHARAQPVGADHRASLVFRAVCESCDHAAVAVLEGRQLLGSVQADLAALAAGLEERAVQVAAVHDGIGAAEMPAKRLAA